MAKIIYCDGTSKHVEPKNGKDFSLEELQSIVGGYIEIHLLNNNLIMVINEEGKLCDLEYNAVATNEYRRVYATTDWIVGDVLICDSNQVK